MTEAKSPELKESVVIGITRIAQALLKVQSINKYQLKSRNQLLEGMIMYVKSGSLSTKPKAMKAITALLQLSPALDIKTEKEDVRSKILECVMSHLNFNAENFEITEAKTPEEKQTRNVNAATLEVLETMSEVLLALLETVPTLESLCQMLLKLEFWVVSKSAMERIQALRTYRILVKRFVDLLREGTKQTEKSLRGIGHYLATAIPRITDTSSKIRDVAMEVVQLLLCSVNFFFFFFFSSPPPLPLF
ncbi:hypothetical protein RFI_17832 [Reticulomyxa filosa]|uniref:MROH2B-like HEAT-repeats domain-containing protein n=1 Tax=Reticulomyxa filosa TaxID=46433 RepID=X6N118_RETFI|nr:hypothetical protein RFI_17832 [Reticulomyxa filosa]|eukprot:ETO19399.1 hypothetical protein RFI_17832 [Reticulomyxa filosa]